MRTIALPRIVGTRREVPVHTAALPADLTGEDVDLDCTRLLSATPSFADELVKVLLVDRHASSLVVTGAGDEFAADVVTAARDRRVEDRVVLCPVSAAQAS